MALAPGRRFQGLGSTPGPARRSSGSRSGDRLHEIHDRVFSVSVDRHRAQRSKRLRRRAAAVAVAAPGVPLLVESHSHEVVRHRERVFRGALVAADVLAGLLVVALADRIFGDTGPGATAFALLPLIVVINTTSGLYRRDELLLRKSTLDEAPAVFHAATLTTVVAFLLESALLRTPMTAHLVVVTWLGLSVLEIACRVAARAIARDATPPERCLLVGDAAVADRLQAKLLASPNVKATFVGWIPFDAPRAATSAPVPGTPDELGRVVSEHDVHRVIVAPDATAHQRVLDVIQGAKALGVRVSVLPRMFEVVGSSVEFDHVDGLTMLGVRRFGLTPARAPLKRAFDLVGAALLPRAARAADGRRSRSRSSSTRQGPVLFRQTRVGRDGRRSRCSSSARWYAGAEPRKDELRERQRGRRAVQDRRRPAHHARRALSAPHLARRAAAALQRPARRDEPRRPAPARASTRTAASRAGTAAACT